MEWLFCCGVLLLIAKIKNKAELNAEIDSKIKTAIETQSYQYTNCVSTQWVNRD